MAISKASIVPLMAVILSVVAVSMASAQSVESPAPSPTSGSGAILPSFISAGVAAVTALLFGSAFSI
ncbi:hypothetical protein AALP_AA8G241500 [Arabis alpina]|uniref:Uncharacterized protein n=1 Tax=Arabis alpina TaxID=50452 RepID=A0A087G931_ARAAL|nr:hypothetical protein AALP_AA8G241500 [Arabis alpina]